jgi:NitT/TauT family transport system permease protein
MAIATSEPREAPLGASLRSGRQVVWRRIRPIALALIVPLLLVGFWQVATTQQWTRLIPTPHQVAEYMVHFAWGGIYDDAYSATC